jgi:hypothetical protein
MFMHSKQLVTLGYLFLAFSVLYGQKNPGGPVLKTLGGHR